MKPLATYVQRAAADPRWALQRTAHRLQSARALQRCTRAWHRLVFVLTARRIPLDKLLTGGFTERKHYLLDRSPHVQFLREFRNATTIDPVRFKSTEYYNHGCEDIAVFGSFFGITQPERVIERAQVFLELYRALKNGMPASRATNDQSVPEEFLSVARIADTDHYVIKHGHHRFAAYYVLGRRSVRAKVLGKAKVTWEELRARGVVPSDRDPSGGVRKRVKKFIASMIVQGGRLIFWTRRIGRRPRTWRLGFLSEEFSHPDLRSFGGYGMTLKYVTDHINTHNGPLRGDVLMCERMAIPRVLFQRYYHADLLFLPRWPGLRTQLQCTQLLARRRTNLLVGVDHYASYEIYLEYFPYLPWIVWIKDPKDRQVWEKLATIDLEIKAWGADNIEELIEQGERRGESLRRMLDLSRAFGRKVLFAAEANHLAEIARRLYGLEQMDAFHWPKPIPVASGEPSFSERPSFLFLARIDPIKRPWIFCELARRFPKADFLLAGTSHHSHIMDPVLARYRDIPNLRFLGRVHGADKEALLKKVWAIVNTSIHEGVPVAMLEGFAHGKPSIAALNPDDLTTRFGIFVGERLGNGNDAETLDRFSNAVEQMITGAFDKEGVGRQAQRYVAEVHSFSYFESTLLRALGVSVNDRSMP